jgi:membrane protein implicated in regulation of membrane protease activity
LIAVPRKDREALVMTWWIWVIAGFALLAAELLTPGGFYLLFFGCGALAVGLLTALGWSGPLWFQGVLFAVLSVISVLLFRKPLVQKMRVPDEGKEVDSLVGETAFAVDRIQIKGFGKAQLRGSAWNAHNVGDQALQPKQRCRVEKVDGLTLWVKGE